MNTYLALFLLATCSSLILTPIVRRLSERCGWLDEPRDTRRVHHKATPRLGGVAVFASVLIALITLSQVNNKITEVIAANMSSLTAVLAPAALVFMFGVYDDLRGSSASQKLIALGMASTLFYLLGGRIEGLSVPFIGSVELSAALGFAVTVLWVVGISNAFNLIDGIDGLAAGAALFAALVMLTVSLMLGHPLVTVFSLALAGALVGFLRYNFNPASIFLGDSGSLFIGFLLAALSVQGAQKASTAVAVATPLMAFGLPVIDTGIAVARRFISNRPLFTGDREHIHHMLLARGWSQRRVALVLYGVCALFGMLSLLFVHDTGRMVGLVLFVVGTATVLAVGRLRYHEVDEVRASMKRNVAERRTRAANNIRVRRASGALLEAISLSEIFSVLDEMLGLGEFIYATVHLGCRDDVLCVEQALARENGALSSQGVKIRNGLIYWSWGRGDIKPEEIIDSSRFWTLHLPLSTERASWGYVDLYRKIDSDALLLDINYLCGFFQREMAQAAERVLSSREEKFVERQMVVSAAGGGLR